MATDFQAFILPELRGLSAAERSSALASARATPFEVAELLGMAASLVAAAALAGRPWPALLLGALFSSPFLVTRLRRGLRQPRRSARP